MRTDEAVKMIELDPPPSLEKIRALRPYRLPKVYMSWRSLSALLSLSPTMMRHPGIDTSGRTVFHRLALWLAQDAPLYCISESLLTAFMQTDVLDRQNLLAGLEAPIPTLLVLPPAGAMKTPAGDNVEYLVIHFSDRRYPERSTGQSADLGIDVHRLDHKTKSVIHIGASDEAGTVWFSGIGLHDDGSVSIERSILDDHEPGDPEFMDLLRSIALQVILALQYQPELFTTQEPTPPRRGFGKVARNEDPRRAPRWLGKDFKPKRPAAQSGGSHASPRTHWRRGHLRKVAVGEGRLERKVIWIQPVLVNG